MMTFVIAGSVTIMLHECMGIMALLQGPLVYYHVDIFIREALRQVHNPLFVHRGRPTVRDKELRLLRACHWIHLPSIGV
jgi:hypothetical protein